MIIVCIFKRKNRHTLKWFEALFFFSFPIIAFTSEILRKCFIQFYLNFLQKTVFQLITRKGRSPIEKNRKTYSFWCLIESFSNKILKKFLKQNLQLMTKLYYGNQVPKEDLERWMCLVNPQQKRKRSITIVNRMKQKKYRKRIINTHPSASLSLPLSLLPGKWQLSLMQWECASLHSTFLLPNYSFSFLYQNSLFSLSVSVLSLMASSQNRTLTALVIFQNFLYPGMYPNLSVFSCFLRYKPKILIWVGVKTKSWIHVLFSFKCTDFS